MRGFIINSGDKIANARSALAPRQAEQIYEVVLAAGVAKRVAIPAGAGHVLFAADTDFRARLGGATVAATIPAGDVLDGSASEINPGARRLGEADTHVSLIAAEDGRITLAFYGE